jgi:hypothetical protein
MLLREKMITGCKLQQEKPDDRPFARWIFESIKRIHKVELFLSGIIFPTFHIIIPFAFNFDVTSL